MQYIQTYESDESFLTEIEHTPELQPRAVRSVYLITYSQADLDKFPTREGFAAEVVAHFQSAKIEIVNWVCCLEEHELHGSHYHLAVKLSTNKRWLPIKQNMQEKHQVVLHFSAIHNNYYSAWRYVTKSDKSYKQSPGHPDLTLTNSPQTSSASKNRIRKRKQNKSSSKTKKVKKQKRLTNSTVSDIICNKNIKTKTELYALAQTQKQEGKEELYNFIINRNAKKILSSSILLGRYTTPCRKLLGRKSQELKYCQIV